MSKFRSQGHSITRRTCVEIHKYKSLYKSKSRRAMTESTIQEQNMVQMNENLSMGRTIHLHLATEKQKCMIARIKNLPFTPLLRLAISTSQMVPLHETFR